MKSKTYKWLLIVFIIFLIIEIIIHYLVTNGYTYINDEFADLKETFITEYRPEEVTNVSQYIGSEVYYVVEFINYSGQPMVAFLNSENKMTYNTKKEDLVDVNAINKNLGNVQLGYEAEQVIYEIKTSTQESYQYQYYNATTGELLRSYKIER